MKKLVAMAAMAAAVGLGAGAAHAQKVADTGMQGLDPASGKVPKQIVVMFHGYTQNGMAMKPLAQELAKRLPDAAFIFNDGPMAAQSGRSWYVLRGEDKDNTRGAVKQIAVDTVNKASDVLKVPHDKIITVGFSQGGGVAFDAGTCVKGDVKAVVSLAGIIANGDCAAEIDGKTPNVLIVHNDADPLVGADRIKAFQDKLTAGGYTSKLEEVKGEAHWPSPDGIQKAEDFIVAQLGG
ncbi:MAG: dienelactone hydrolase family protein [Hyphomonadaceae bacterium]